MQKAVTSKKQLHRSEVEPILFIKQSRRKAMLMCFCTENCHAHFETQRSSPKDQKRGEQHNEIRASKWSHRPACVSSESRLMLAYGAEWRIQEGRSFFLFSFFRRDALKEQFGKRPNTVRCLAVKSTLLGTRHPRKGKEAALQNILGKPCIQIWTRKLDKSCATFPESSEISEFCHFQNWRSHSPP